MKRTVLTLALACASLPAALSVRAQDAGVTSSNNAKFLQIPGIPGDSTADRHKDWIDLLSFGQTLTPARGRRLSCQGEITKYLDRASPALWAAVASGDSFPEMTIEFANAGGRGEQVFLQQKLIDVRVLRVVFQENGSAPVEALSLLPESIVLKYFPEMRDGTQGPAIERTISCSRDRDDHRYGGGDISRMQGPLPGEQP